VPLNLKVLAMYFQTSSFRRLPRFSLSSAEFQELLFRSGLSSLERLVISMEKRPRHFIAVDETCVNVNGEKY